MNSLEDAMRRIAWIAITVLMTATPSLAGIGVTVKGGTLGVGVEGTLGLIPLVNLRGGLNALNLSRDLTAGDIDYDADLELLSGHVLADLHPIPFRGFRVSGGLLYNANGLTMESESISTSIEVGGQTYQVSDVGTLVSEVDFNTTVPYLGIGWGNAAANRFVFAVDIGVVFQGSPQVTSRATGPISSDPAFQQELRRETQELEDDVAWFKYYPVLSIGFGFKITP